MAQLRDATTATVVFEGTPVEIAVIAEAIGFAEVLFDDVGVNFDPQATLTEHRESIAINDQIATSPDMDDDAKTFAKTAANDLRKVETSAAKNKAKVTKAIQTAREAREQAMRNA